MKIVRNIILVILVFLAIIVLGATIIFNRWTRGPIPQHSGQITLVGLDAPVEILRDRFGIPHIYATTTHDLFFAQGYTQAQDRWWQMEFGRHIGRGALQELTGRNTDLMSTDVFIRTLGWYQSAERDYAAADEESRAALEAFADGVNSYIISRPAGELAFEYNVLGLTGINITIQPWSPVDTVVWSKVMAWDLGGNRSQELLRAALIETLGEDMANDYLPPFPYGEKPTILSQDDLPLSASSLQAQNLSRPQIATLTNPTLAGGLTMHSPLFRQQSAIGSNNWVIGGDRTSSGLPLLANDPHLGIGMPSIWYEVGLHCQPVNAACPYDVTGFAFPASPAVIIGHNQHIAWGVTNVGPDTQDLYEITINPDNPLQYRWNDEWRDMTLREETIHFGDEPEPITLQVRETHLGPVLTDNDLDDDGLPLGFNNDEAMAFHWTTTTETGTLLTALLRLNRADNWEAFRDALSYWDSPSQNVIYADIEGNIGYQVPSLMPIRPAGHTGMVPILADGDEDEWLGYIPFDNLPRIYNPERGYIATANQAVVPLEYYDQLRAALSAEFGADAVYSLGNEWDYGYRGQRINELVEATNPQTIATMQMIHGDNKNLSAEELRPYIEELDMGTPAYNQVRDWMLDWDYDMDSESQPAGLYTYFWRELVQTLFNDQLGDIEEAGIGNQTMYATYRLLDQPENPWWDDIHTSDAVETRDEILIRAFRTAVDRITTERGIDRTNWAWGQLHTATFVSNPLGLSGIDVIEGLVNRGPFETSGGDGIVNATGWDGPSGTFEVDTLPSMRMIVDLSNLARSQTIHTTGQSGHPFSPHYSDMIELWRTIQYHPMLWERDAVQAAAINTLILSPGS
jgi:penicillin G amidase